MAVTGRYGNRAEIYVCVLLALTVSPPLEFWRCKPMRNPRDNRHPHSPGPGDGQTIRHIYEPLLRSANKHDRMRALDELEYLNCERDLSRRTKLTVVALCLANFHIRPRVERRAIARFLDAWLESQPERAVAKRLAAIRMEEIDPGIRDSLVAAYFAVRPTGELIDLLIDPPEELLRDGYGLLVALDALNMRVRNEELGVEVLDDIILALRRARAIRKTPVVRPFAWQVETVLEHVCKRRGVPVPG
jgi:hypothetical protein